MRQADPKPLLPWALSLAGALVCVAVLIWGLIERLNFWDAQPYVALLYAATALTALAAGLGVRGRTGPSPRRVLAALTVALVLLVVGGHLYLQLQPARDAVFWIQRQAFGLTLH